MYKNILIPLDTSELAECALPHAIGLAKNSDARITLIAVMPIMPYAPAPASTAGIGAFPATPGPGSALSSPLTIEDEAARIQEYLGRMKKQLELEGMDVSVVFEQGDPASVICDYAKESDVDLIVISTHGRTGLARWVFGSVATRVLQAATVPTLLVRACVADFF